MAIRMSGKISGPNPFSRAELPEELQKEIPKTGGRYTEAQRQILTILVLANSKPITPTDIMVALWNVFKVKMPYKTVYYNLNALKKKQTIRPVRVQGAKVAAGFEIEHDPDIQELAKSLASQMLQGTEYSVG